MGRHGRAVRLGLAVALFSVTVGAGSSADAHMGTDWLDGRWGTSSLNFTFTASVPPNSPFPNRDRIREGFQEWPSKTASPTVTFDTSTLNWPPSTPCSYGFGVNGIHYYAIDGQYGTRARTSRCFQTPGSGVLVNVQTTFDSGETWWTYDSTSGLSTTYLDMESVAAHEAGHAIGWGLPISRVARSVRTAARITRCAVARPTARLGSARSRHTTSTPWKATTSCRRGQGAVKGADKPVPLD